MVIEELVTLWGFDVDFEPLKKLNEGLSIVKSTVTAVGTAVVVGIAGLFGLTAAAASSAAALERNAQRIDATVEELQGMEYAMATAGLEMNDLLDVMKDMDERASAAHRGEESSAEGFNLLKVSVRDANGELKSGLPLFKEIATKLAGIDDTARRTDIGMKIMGEGAFKLMPVILQTGEGIDQLVQEFTDLGVILSGDQVRALSRVNLLMVKTRAIVKGLGNQIGADLAPYVEGLTEDFVALVKENRALIRSSAGRAIRTLGEFAIWTARGVKELVSWIARTVEAVGGADRVIALLKGSLVFLTSLLAVSLVRALYNATVALRAMGTEAILTQAKALALPLAIAAIIALIALVVEDLYQWSQGNESLIGSLLKSNKTLQKLVHWSGKLQQGISDLIDWFAELGTAAGEGLENALGWAQELADTVLGLPDKASAAFGRLKAALGIGGPGLEASVATSGAAAAVAADSAYRSSVSNRSFKVDVNGDNNFMFGGAPGAPLSSFNRAAQTRDDMLRESLRRTLVDLDSGVEY